jgi:hypothetical protein
LPLWIFSLSDNFHFGIADGAVEEAGRAYP